MESAVLQRRSLRQKSAIVLLTAQLLVACIAWLAAWYELESIVGTGPLLTIIGLALAIVVRPLGSWTPVLVGLSAPVVCATGAFAIAIFRLGPGEAQYPILFLLTIYLLVTAPAAIVAFTQILHWPIHPRVSKRTVWRFSMKSLLIAMTGIAMLTVAITAAVKSLPDFPVVFATYGAVAFVLAGLIVWRFSTHRQQILNSTTGPQPLMLRELFDRKTFAFLLQQPDVRCSFCGRTHRDAGPFAEGRGGSLICRQCAEACTELIIETGTSSGESGANALRNNPPDTR
jgi:ClpX C4-type zinc finger